MGTFLHKFLDSKRFVFLAIIIVFICGFLFGFFDYRYCQDFLKSQLQYLFYLNSENYHNQYQLYLIQNGLYILICTYLSTSYFGHLGILLLSFLKGVQLSFSIVYVCTIIQLDVFIALLMLIEICIEISFIAILSYMNIHLSLYVTLISFYIEQNFHIKNIINYRLNCLIATLVLFSLSLAFRIYIIPFF